MDRTRFVDHRGKRILLLDFSRVRDPAETLAAIGVARQVVRRHPPRSLLVLTSTREGRYNAAVIQALKELASHNEPYVRASAVAGMSGLHRVAFQAILTFSKRKIQVFDLEEDAMDWLAAQA